MSEYAGLGLRALFTMIDNAVPVAVNSGIIGNTAHKTGYHRSRKRLLDTGHTNDYSIQASEDKQGPAGACCGLDVSLPPAEMKRHTARMIKACQDNDPRLKALREVLGTVNGTTVTGYNRVATGSGSRSKVGLVSADSSHLWHMHFSILRKYADDIAACKNIGAVFLGLPLPVPTLPKIIINGKEYDDLTTVSVAGVNLARDTGVFSRHVYYVQRWLGKTFPTDPPSSIALTGREGYWDARTQAEFNDFRESLGWTGADVVGAVGITSLSSLATKAGSSKPVRV